MALTPCSVFWDIQNIGVPKGQSAETIVSLVRTSLVNLYQLREIYFYCVCDVTKIPASLGNQLTSQDVSIIQAYDYTKDSADIKILDFMRKFVENQGRQGCSIILLSGDGDYTATLNDLKRLFNVTIYLIRLRSSFAASLEAVANYTFELCDGKLRPIKALGEPKCLVSFSRFPMTKPIRVVKLDMSRKAQPYGCIDRSAIDHDGEVIIGFPSTELARRAVTALDAARYFGTFLRVRIVSDPITEISIKMKRAQFFTESKRKQLRSLRIRRRRILSNIEQPSFGRRRRNLSEDFIPLSSSNSRGYNSPFTSRSPFNPFRSSSNQKCRSIQSSKINASKNKNDSDSNNNDNVNDLQVTTKTDTGSRWVSLYSETTSIRSPILIDLTANSPGLKQLKDIRLQPPSSSSSSEIIPMVDLTDET